MKKKLISWLTLLALAISLLLPVIAAAHSGRLDKKGGHYVRNPKYGKVGSYHRHR